MMEVNREDYEALKDDLFDGRLHSSTSKKQFFKDGLLIPSMILVLLLWGTIVLLKVVPILTAQEIRDHGRLGSHRNFYNQNGGKALNSRHTKDGSLKISFENVRNNTFKPKLQSLQWLRVLDFETNDRGLFMTVSNDTYMVKSVHDKEYCQILYQGKDITIHGTAYKIDSLVASPDLKRLLIRTNSVANWRHSYFGTYYIYEIEDSEFYKISDNIAVAQWSPNSIDISFVQDNDLYIYSTETHSISKKITKDGSENIFNGKPDWVYEEEVLESDTALWWSPNGKFIAFFKTLEDKVKEIVIPYYVQNEINHTNGNDLYPEMRSIKYPKAGTSNPEVDVWVYSLEEDRSYPVNINKEHRSNPLLITELFWVNENTFVTKVSDRSSDVLTVLTVDAITQDVNTARNDPAEESWWEITHDTKVVPKNPSKGRDTDGYIDIIPVDGYNHLVYYKSYQDSEPIILTTGNWEVTSDAISFDQENDRLYFIATKKSSVERHLYYIHLSKPGKVHAVTDTDMDGVFSVSFSPGNRFVLLTYRGPDIPYQKIIDLRSKQKDHHTRGNIIGETLYYLEKNDELRHNLLRYSVPEKSFDELYLGMDDNGQDIIVNSFEILPNDFNPELRNHYPVFFFAYGGPNSQQVIKTFSVGFNEVIASQLNAIVVCVDGRGTGFKGKKFRSIVRDNLGDYEARDQISAASIYGGKSYVNAEKISLFGWSYGGYLTLKTLEKDAGEHFKYGISVAPVTDWSLYDSIYTERYMHTPQENIDGYDNSNVANVKNIGKCKRLLIMHGSGDDNVHVQNTMIVLDKFNSNNVANYDMMIFPDSSHAIKYHNANRIVYDKMLDWTRQAFNGDFETYN